MNDNDLLARLDRSARSVARLSTATRILSAVMLGIALIMLLYAFSRADRHTGDFVGFGLLSIGIAALSLVFAGNAAFHAAFGDAMRLAVEVHINLERLAHAQGKGPRPVAAPAAPGDPTAPSPPEDADAPPHGAPPDGAPPEGNAEPAAAKPQPAAEGTRERGVPTHVESASAEPAMKPCPACHQPIRADALRCRHCMQRV